MGASIDGFGEEILALLRKMELRKRGSASSWEKKKKKTTVGSKFEKEFRKLECLLNYNSASIKGRTNGKSI